MEKQGALSAAPRSSSNVSGRSLRQCTHSFHTALSMRFVWTYLHNECCKCCAPSLSERGYSVTVTSFLLHGQAKFFRLLNKGSKLKNARVNIGAFFKTKNSNNDNKRNNSVCGLKSCGLMRCKPVTFCSSCLQDATTTKKGAQKASLAVPLRCPLSAPARIKRWQVQTV